jgi:hypothetical protein
MTSASEAFVKVGFIVIAKQLEILGSEAIEMAERSEAVLKWRERCLVKSTA